MLNGMENRILVMSFDFSLEIIGLYKILLKHSEFVLSKQLLRSATSIGANVVRQTQRRQKEISFLKCQSPQRRQGKQGIG